MLTPRIVAPPAPRLVGPLVRSVQLRGGDAAILWGWHTAALISSWAIAKPAGGAWTLTAATRRVDEFMLRQLEPRLHFTAERKVGFWCWPIVRVQVMPGRLVATLGQPEQ